MAIRQVTSRTIKDVEIVAADLADKAVTSGKIADSATLGARSFQGETGSRGDSSSGKGAIFRVK